MRRIVPTALAAIAVLVLLEVAVNVVLRPQDHVDGDLAPDEDRDRGEGGGHDPAHHGAAQRRITGRSGASRRRATAHHGTVRRITAPGNGASRDGPSHHRFASRITPST